MLISYWTKNKCTRAIHDKNKNLVSKAQCVHRIIQPQKIKTHAQTQKLIALMDFCSHHFFMKISFYFWFIMCHLKNIVFLEKKNNRGIIWNSLHVTFFPPLSVFVSISSCKESRCSCASLLVSKTNIFQVSVSGNSRSLQYKCQNWGLASELNDYRSPPSSSFWSPATTLVLINQGEVGMKSFKTPACS